MRACDSHVNVHAASDQPVAEAVPRAEPNSLASLRSYGPSGWMSGSTRDSARASPGAVRIQLSVAAGLELQMPHAATTTDTWPGPFRVGFTRTSTSWPSAARNSIRRSAEKPRARPFRRSDTCGCGMPRSLPACAWVPDVVRRSLPELCGQRVRSGRPGVCRRRPVTQSLRCAHGALAPSRAACRT